MQFLYEKERKIKVLNERNRMRDLFEITTQEIKLIRVVLMIKNPFYLQSFYNHEKKYNKNATRLFSVDCFIQLSHFTNNNSSRLSYDND